MNLRNTAALAAFLSSAGALAHGPQVQVTNTGGKVTTRSVLIDTYGPLSPERSAYVAPVRLVEDPDFGPAWRAIGDADPANPFGPGIAYGLGATFPSNSTLTLSFAGELERWDGAAFVSAGATELAALRTGNPNAGSLGPAANRATSGTDDPLAEITVSATQNDNSHASVTYVLLGDGLSPTAAVSDGLYRATLMLASSDPGIAPSAPFFLLLNKGADAALPAALGSLGLAAGSVQLLAVPEPAAGLSAVLALAACARRRASRRA